MTSSRWAQNHRITAWLKLEGMSGDHLVKPLCSSRTTQRQLPRTIPRWLLIITKDGDPTTSLCNLCQGWLTLTAVLGSSFRRRKYWPCGQRTTSASKTPGITTVVMNVLWLMRHVPKCLLGNYGSAGDKQIIRYLYLWKWVKLLSCIVSPWQLQCRTHSCPMEFQIPVGSDNWTHSRTILTTKAA